jgi:hypothetical protein
MPNPLPSRPAAPLLLAILACAVACLAVSSQSFWIDEAQTALKVVPPTLQGWWHALDTEHNSNMQLPLYMLYIWSWGRVFGVSELALRAANIPWFLLGLFAILHFLRRRAALRNAMALLYCLHPFVWYYLNEARLYMMQLSGALLACGALFAAMDEAGEPLSRAWWLLLGAGMTILCGAGLLGVPWAIGITAVLLCLPRFRQSISRSALPALAIFGPLLVALALYFAWTIQQKIGTGTLPMNLPSIMAIFYEQLGFLGLGPGRSTLRSESVASLKPYLPALLLLAAPLAWGLVAAGRRCFGLPRRCMAPVMLLAASPVCLIVALGFARHARILARHLTPLFPFVLAMMACALLWLWRSGRPLGRAAAILMAVALAASSLEVRFAFRHSKDDYRSAAASAVQSLAAGKIVWWAADPDAADYYRLPITERARPGAALWVYTVPVRYPAPPDVIYLSKPDLADATGTITAYIAKHHYVPAATWQAFTLWQAPHP